MFTYKKSNRHIQFCVFMVWRNKVFKMNNKLNEDALSANHIVKEKFHGVVDPGSG